MTWAEKIERAKRTGTFTDLDRLDSRSWDSCSLGERFLDLTDRSLIHETWDLTEGAIDLGMDFSNAVLEGRIADAERINKKIQKLEQLEITL